MAVPHDLRWGPWSRTCTGCLWDCPVLQARKLRMVRGPDDLDASACLPQKVLTCSVVAVELSASQAARGGRRWHRTVKGQKPRVRNYSTEA